MTSIQNPVKSAGEIARAVPELLKYNWRTISLIPVRKRLFRGKSPHLRKSIFL
jgi:hypothetical protein